jgi:enamine deaminase RidA (YjgF/YER057c/UK114 family)
VKAAGLVFVSGTAPHDPATGAIKGTTIQEQTRQCLTNIAAILEAAGSSVDKIVSATVVLADEDDFAGMNQEWLKWFPSDPRHGRGEASGAHTRAEGIDCRNRRGLAAVRRPRGLEPGDRIRGLKSDFCVTQRLEPFTGRTTSLEFTA